MTVKTNIAAAVQVVLKQLPTPEATDKMLRTSATTVLSLIKKRVHRDGIDSAGQQIGTYSPGYMKVRTGKYKNAKIAKKGLKAGVVTHAGVFTKGKNKGAARPRYNRTDDKKVIGSLTRQMENDLKVTAIAGGYAIGYSNEHNYNKSQWLEKTYKKPIWKMSDAEEQAIKTIVANAIS